MGRGEPEKPSRERSVAEKRRQVERVEDDESIPKICSFILIRRCNAEISAPKSGHPTVT